MKEVIDMSDPTNNYGEDISLVTTDASSLYNITPSHTRMTC